MEADSILMCSFDIVQMFPNITKEIGLPACRKHLDKRDRKIFSSDCITEGIEITLDHNLTTFGDEMYRQIKGTAMGPANACDYADIAMVDLDELVHSNQLPELHGIPIPTLFERFRDDIFILWLSKPDKLIELFNLINTFYPTIKFTMTEPTTEGLEFLDTFVYIKEKVLHTKPFSKPCDNHQYLSPNSCHPHHNIANIPYCIAYRLFKITSEPVEYEKVKIEYSTYLSDRNYSLDCINEAFDKVEKLDRMSLIYTSKLNSDKTNDDIVNTDNIINIDLNTDRKLNNRNFPLVCDFNPDLPPVGRIISKHKSILELDADLVKVINPKNIFVSYRGNPTLDRILAPSKLRSLNKNSDHDQNDQDSSKNSRQFGSFKCETVSSLS